MGIAGGVATRPDWLRPSKLFFYFFFVFPCVYGWFARAHMRVCCKMGLPAYECLWMCSLVRTTLPLRGCCILGVIGLLPWGVFILWWHAQGRGRVLRLCGLTQMCWCLASSSLEFAVPDYLILVLYSVGGYLGGLWVSTGWFTLWSVISCGGHWGLFLFVLLVVCCRASQPN